MVVRRRRQSRQPTALVAQTLDAVVGFDRTEPLLVAVVAALGAAVLGLRAGVGEVPFVAVVAERLVGVVRVAVVDAAVAEDMVVAVGVADLALHEVVLARLGEVAVKAVVA